MLSAPQKKPWKAWSPIEPRRTTITSRLSPDGDSKVWSRTTGSLSFKTLDGDDLRLSDQTGRPVLVVNTASP